MRQVTNWVLVESKMVDMIIEQEYTSTYDGSRMVSKKHHDHVRIQIGNNWSNKLYMDKASANKLWKTIRVSSCMKQTRRGLTFDGCVWDFWKTVIKIANELDIQHECCC